MRCNGSVVASFRDAATCNAFFLNAQDTLCDIRTCSERRRDRIPVHGPAIFARAAGSTIEAERKHFKPSAAEKFRVHRQAVKVLQAQYIVRTGRVFQRSKTLYKIEGLQLENGNTSACKNYWQQQLLLLYDSQ